MPSSLPVDLAQRVFATHPAPLAEAVWALETTGSPDGKRQTLEIAARTMLRLVAGAVLAARLQRGNEGETRRAGELIRTWRARLLTDAEWLELMREITRAPGSDFPLPKLMELTQGSDGARFIVAMKRLLGVGDEPSLSLDEALTQFSWLLERLDPVWADARLAVPHEAPADAHAKQEVLALAGVADASPFEQTELAAHVRLPPDRPVLTTVDGKPRVSLYPVLQWKRDVPGLGNGLFFLEGCEHQDEVYRSYPTMMELRQPRPKGAVEAETAQKEAASAKSRRQRNLALAAMLVVVVAGGSWRFFKLQAVRRAAAAKAEAVRQAAEKERAAEAAYAAEAAKALAQVRETLRQRHDAISENGKLHRTSAHQTEVLKLTEALASNDTPAARNELLEARVTDTPMTWRAFTTKTPGCAAVTPDGNALALVESGALVWRDTGTGDPARNVELTGGCAQLAVANDSAVVLLGDHTVWRLPPNSDELSQLDLPEVDRVALSPDGKVLAYSAGTRVIVRVFGGKRDPATLTRHKGAILDIAFAPDSKQVATASADGSVRLWDAESGREIKVFGQLEGVEFRSVAFSPDGRIIAAASSDRSIRLWETASGKQIHSLKLENPASRIAFAADQDGVLVAREKEVSIINAASGALTARFSVGDAAGISLDGRWLATRETNGVRLWDLRPHSEPEVLRPTAFTAAAFSPDGRLVALAGRDFFLAWDETRRLAQFPYEDGKLQQLAVSPSGATAETVDEAGRATLWTLGKILGAVIDKAPLYPHGIVAYSPSGASLGFADDNGVAMFDAYGAQQRWTAQTGAPVVALAFAPDDSTVLGLTRLSGTNGEDQEEYIQWSLATGKQLGRWPAGNVLAMAAAVDGRALFVAGTTLRSTTFPPGSNATPFEPTPELDTMSRLLLSPDGHSLFGMGEKGVWWWDVPTRHLRGFLKTGSPAPDLALTPDGLSLLARGRLISLTDAFGPEGRDIPPVEVVLDTTTLSDDSDERPPGIPKTARILARAATAHRVTAATTGGVTLWNTATNEPIAEIKTAAGAISAAAYSADGTLLALGRDDGQILLRLGDASGNWFASQGGAIRALAFSPDGRVLVSASADKTIKLWRLSAGGEPKALLALSTKSPPTSLTFTSDRPLFVSGYEDGSAREWNIDALISFFSASPQALLAETRAKWGITAPGGNAPSASVP